MYWEAARTLVQGEPAERARVRTLLNEAGVRQRADGQRSVLPFGALTELRDEFGRDGWTALRM